MNVALSAITYSPDAKVLAVGAENGEVQILNANDLKQKAQARQRHACCTVLR